MKINWFSKVTMTLLLPFTSGLNVQPIYNILWKKLCNKNAATFIFEHNSCFIHITRRIKEVCFKRKSCVARTKFLIHDIGNGMKRSCKKKKKLNDKVLLSFKHTLTVQTHIHTLASYFPLLSGFFFLFFSFSFSSNFFFLRVFISINVLYNMLVKFIEKNTNFKLSCFKLLRSLCFCCDILKWKELKAVLSFVCIIWNCRQNRNTGPNVYLTLPNTSLKKVCETFFLKFHILKRKVSKFFLS